MAKASRRTRRPRRKPNTLFRIVGRIKDVSAFLEAVKPATLRLPKSSAPMYRGNPVDDINRECEEVTSVELSRWMLGIAADVEALIGTPEAAPAPKASPARMKKR